MLVIADMHFQTNFNETLEQQHLLLPRRMLRHGDKPPFVPDFTKAENKGLYAMHLIRKLNEETKGLVLKLWGQAMCTPKGRKDGRDLMKKFITHPEVIPRDLLKILVDFIRDHDC